MNIQRYFLDINSKMDLIPSECGIAGLVIEENDNNASISLKLNQWLENKIRKNPSQWIWTHNRWK